MTDWRWEFWKESSEYWQEEYKSLKAKNQGKFTKAVFISGFSFCLGIIIGARF